MTTEAKEIGPCKYLLKIEVPPAKIKKKLETQYQEFIKDSVIPGFRKGKAPRNLVERKFGKEITEKTKLDLIGDSYDEALKEKKFTPITEPKLEAEKITLEKDKALCFEVTVEVEPKINIKEYTGVSVKRIKPKVSEKDIDEALTQLKESKAELVPAKDTVIKQGDHVIVDEELLAISTKPVPNEASQTDTLRDPEGVPSRRSGTFGKTNNQQIGKQENVNVVMDPKRANPELVNKLIDSKIGDTREMKINIPKNYPRKEWRNTPALAKVTIKEIKRLKLPKATDAWAKEINFESLQHLKEELKKRLLQTKAKETEHLMENEIIKKILEKSDFVLPETLIKRGTDYLLERQKVNLYLKGVPEDQVSQEIEKQRSVSQETAITTIKNQRLIDYIAQKEKIFITEDEIAQWFNERAQATGRWPNEIKTYYEKNNLMGSLRGELKEQKVRKLLREKAKITD